MHEVGVKGSGRLLLLAGCILAGAAAAAEPTPAELSRALADSFSARGQAGMERLVQDETQRLCSGPVDAGLPPAVAARVREINRRTVVPPADGDYFGDRRAGEQVAQSGAGLQFNDDPGAPAGGNCYACHELAGDVLAYGTLGPSLRHYGKLRGTSPAVLEYTWAKLYNSNAHMPCSNMPRFGHRGILTEQQLKDVMAFLFDPDSPVNR